ncbi:MAG: hypothetical protein ACOZCO_17270 [Bacteroidota bacterium]
MKSFLLFVFLFSFPFCVFSQGDSVFLGKMVVIFTSDDGEHIGQLLEINDREYLLSTRKNGNVFIPKYTIQKIELLTDENFVNNKYIAPNRFYPYYAITSNALPVKKGDVFIRTPFLLTAVAEVGINDKWAWSVGNAVVFGLGTSLRYNLPLSGYNQLGFCAGYGGVMLLMRDNPPADKQGYYSRIYYTRGKAERNVTVGLGYASTFSGKISSPFTSLGGMIRAGRNWVFLFEGIIISYYRAGMAGCTARMFTKKRSAIDFGINLVMWEDTYTNYPSPVVYHSVRAFPLPAIGYHIKF